MGTSIRTLVYDAFRRPREWTECRGTYETFLSCLWSLQRDAQHAQILRSLSSERLDDEPANGTEAANGLEKRFPLSQSQLLAGCTGFLSIPAVQRLVSLPESALASASSATKTLRGTEKRMLGQFHPFNVHCSTHRLELS